YTVDVRIVDEVDPNEPNDTAATARRATVITAVGASQTFTGRLGYVPDPDWYQVDLTANAAPTVLYYRVTPAAGGGRFPALPGRSDRQLKVFREVTGGTLVQNQQDCLNNQAICPKGYLQGDDYSLLMVEGFCNNGNPPKCLWANREEHPSFTNFRNFEGAIQVPPHAAALKYLLVFDDSGNDFADDRDYSLRLEWRADPDDAARFAGTVEGTTTLSLPEVSAAGFPVPGAGAASFSGTLAHGHGNLLGHDPNRGDGVRGPLDYDAVPSDVDNFELTLPAVPDGGTGFLDRTWELQWDVQNTDGGVAPYDLALNVTFCDGVPGACNPVGPALLSYVGDPLHSWQNDSPYQPIYDRASAGGVTTVTARAFGCFCIEPRFMRGGKLSVKVEAVDRTDFTPLRYTVRTALTAYPQSYGLAAGGTKSCPAPVLVSDGGTGGGCQFTQ
ncbi:MAG: cell-cell cohesion protein MtsF, partial [Myxococcaceae bacterium]